MAPDSRASQSACVASLEALIVPKALRLLTVRLSSIHLMRLCCLQFPRAHVERVSGTEQRARTSKPWHLQIPINIFHRRLRRLLTHQGPAWRPNSKRLRFRHRACRRQGARAEIKARMDTETRKKSEPTCRQIRYSRASITLPVSSDPGRGLRSLKAFDRKLDFAHAPVRRTPSQKPLVNFERR